MADFSLPVFFGEHVLGFRDTLMTTHPISAYAGGAIARAFLSLLILLLPAAERIASAIDISQNASFSTSDQSLFGTGSATTCCADMSVSLFKWGPNALPLTSLQPVFIPNVKLQFSKDYLGGSASANITAATDGDIRLVNKLTLDGGGVNATLPYNITLDVPTYTQFAKTGNAVQDAKPFSVLVKDVQYTNNGTMTSASPIFQDVLSLDFNGKASLSLDAKASLLGKEWSGDFGGRLPPTGDFNMSMELFSFNKKENGEYTGKIRIFNQFKLPDLVKNYLLEPKKTTAKVVDDPKKLVDQNTGKPATTPPPDPKTPATAKQSSFKFSTSYQPDIFAAKFKYPFITLDASKPEDVTGTLKKTGKAEFAALEVNLLSLYNFFFPTPADRREAQAGSRRCHRRSIRGTCQHQGASSAESHADRGGQATAG